MPVPLHTVHYLEIVTPDPPAARDLLAAVHGWHFSPPVAELGQAYVADLADGSRCGIRAPMSASEQPLVRSYVRVGDLAAAVQRVVGEGAEVLLDRMELPGHGAIAIYRLGGVEQGLWQLP